MGNQAKARGGLAADMASETKTKTRKARTPKTNNGEKKDRPKFGGRTAYMYKLLDAGKSEKEIVEMTKDKFPGTSEGIVLKTLKTNRKRRNAKAAKTEKTDKKEESVAA